ncbi:MAG: Fic family protein [Bacteroidota bacterium]
MSKYIYEYKNWPTFTWEEKVISTLFGEVRMMQGRLIGQMNALGFSEKEEVTLTALSLDIVKSSEIEGEVLDFDVVRSSIARRLGLETGGLVPSSRQVEGVVDMMMDATQRFREPLTHDRLFGWHAALFPTGYSGSVKIDVGSYRSGEMQVVSGALGKEKIHYEAVKASKVRAEMTIFLKWFNKDHSLDPVLKAAVAHFWFIIIHPFDDGNGRIARAISDMLLAQAESSGERFYSMSGQILVERKQYYSVLQKVQHSSGDITEWMQWFLSCLKNAITSTQQTTEKIMYKVVFWKKHERTPLNERQRLVLNRLLDGFDGKLQTSKWAKITKTSNDTALRDIKDLLEKGILMLSDDGGRSTHYILKR